MTDKKTVDLRAYIHGVSFIGNVVRFKISLRHKVSRKPFKSFMDKKADLFGKPITLLF